MTLEHMFDVNGNAREVKYRRFIVKNLDILDDLIALFEADCKGTGYLQNSRTAEKIREVYSKMLQEQVPLSLSQLAVNGNDMAQLGFKGKEIGETLGQLWDMALRRSDGKRKRNSAFHSQTNKKKYRKEEG